MELAKRLGLGLVITALFAAVCGFGLIGLRKLVSSHSPAQDAETEPAGMVGKVIECSRDFKLASHAEILGYGLQEPRGLAYDAHNGRILIADGPRRKLVSYSIAGGHFEKPAISESFEYCPKDSSEAVDLRGLAMLKDSLYMVEHDRARIAFHALGGVPDQEFKVDWSLLGTRLAGGLSGIAFDASGTTAFITDDRSWPGAVYQVQNGKAQLISQNLPHPSGVAVSPEGQALYVTVCDGRQMQWITFHRESAKSPWQGPRILAGEKMIDGSIPPYAGILVSESGHIYAAGPGGIYVFNVAGISLAQMEFPSRVTGLAWGFDAKGTDRYLYFTAGHALCRLRMEERCDLP